MPYLIGMILFLAFSVFCFGSIIFTWLGDNVTIEVGGREYTKKEIEYIIDKKEEFESKIVVINNKLRSYKNTIINDPRIKEQAGKIKHLTEEISEYSLKNSDLTSNIRILKNELEMLESNKVALERRIVQFEDTLPQYYKNAKLMLD